MPQCEGCHLEKGKGSVPKLMGKKVGQMFRFQLNLPTEKAYESTREVLKNNEC